MAILHGPAENVFPTKVGTFDSFAGGLNCAETNYTLVNLI